MNRITKEEVRNTMTATKRRIAALLLAAMVSTAGAFAASATVAASEAHAFGNSGNLQTH
jgi:hypothetical protein